MDDASLAVTRHRIDVDEYYRMAEAGILTENDHVELIDGEIIDMAPIGQGHASVVTRLNQSLVFAFGTNALVSPQNPVRLDNLNEPQPDFAVLRPRADFYATGDRPGPADVLLLIEVAASSLRYDRLVKLPLYARNGIAEVWIVDLQHRLLTSHRRPGPDGYDDMTTYRRGDTITLAMAPDIVLPIERVLG